MECELKQGQRICPYCNVRHIGRCPEDVDRWRICKIVGEWCPYTRAGKALTDVWSERISNRLWNVLFDSLFYALRHATNVPTVTVAHKLVNYIVLIMEK